MFNSKTRLVSKKLKSPKSGYFVFTLHCHLFSPNYLSNIHCSFFSTCLVVHFPHTFSYIPTAPAPTPVQLLPSRLCLLYLLICLTRPFLHFVHSDHRGVFTLHECSRVHSIITQTLIYHLAFIQNTSQSTNGA